MKAMLKTYAHPVLGNGDDFSSIFDVSFDYATSEDRSEWIIGHKVAMSNPYIQHLIETGAAAYHLEVECPATFFRQAFNTAEQIAQFTLPATRLRGRVELESYIVALDALPDYCPAEMHEDYGDRAFNIKAGDILGVGGTWSFPAELDFDPLKASANSFIKIEKGPHKKGHIEAQHGSSEIIIRLPQDDYDKFQEVANEKLFEDILHATIVFPVLVEAVQIAQKPRGVDYNDRLRAILEHRNLMKEDPFIVAQTILQFPVSRSLGKLQLIKESE